MLQPELKNEPYCGNCGYQLTGAVESSKCPECGRPLVEVLTRKGQSLIRGRRYRSKATLWGLPVIHIAIGPAEGELRGKAKGIIAIGDMAFGFLALGGMACGGVALGGVGMGLFSIGGLAIGLITALGGCAVGGIAVGGAAIGVLALGSGAVGVWAQGAGAFGMFARDVATWRRMGRAPPEGFEPVSWFFGAWPPDALSFVVPVGVVLALPVVCAAGIGWVALRAIRREAQGDAVAASSKSA